jgi:N-acyl homoserine lactone hydrolase
VTGSAVRRVDFGYFVRPAEETGSGRARVQPCLGYAVELGRGWLLFDTGMGFVDTETDDHYRPHRVSLDAALHRAGILEADVRSVANCHLHFDHCGNNPALLHRPVFVQAVELATARSVPDYTASPLIDYPEARYEELDGEHELFPGVWAIPTPGHTQGHQSLVIRSGDGTAVVLAGQSHDTSATFADDDLARRARTDVGPQSIPDFPSWMERLQRFDPSRVYFAHDQSVWEPLPTA